ATEPIPVPRGPVSAAERLRAGIGGVLSLAASAWRGTIIGVPYVWLLLFFLIPFAIVLKISLAESITARPPYTSLLDWTEDMKLVFTLSFATFEYLLEDSLSFLGYLNAVKIAAISTILCLIVGYPMAYGIARSPLGSRNILLLLVILPFWTSFL